MKQITQEKKADIFKYLSNHSLYETGIFFGYDKYYKTKSGLVSLINRIYNEVKQNPKKFNIQAETQALIVQNAENRKLEKAGQPVKVTIEKDFPLDELRNEDFIKKISRKSLVLLNRKLDLVSKSNKSLKSVPLPHLTVLAGIMFDKERIIKGQPTDFIAQYSKIELDITPEAKLKMLLDIQESIENK